MPARYRFCSEIDFVTERKEFPDSEEMLGPARRKAEQPDRGDRPDPAGTPAADSQRRGRRSRLISQEGALVPTRGSRLGDRNTYLLEVDGREKARVATAVKDDRLKVDDYSGFMLRTTDVIFFDETDVEWRITSDLPAPEPLEAGHQAELYRLEKRKITVQEHPIGKARPGSPMGLIAETRGTIDRPRLGLGRRSISVYTGGREFSLTPARKARRGEIASFAVIKRKSLLRTRTSRWTVETTKPLPIAAVLVHWHLLLGDFAESDEGIAAAVGTS